MTSIQLFILLNKDFPAAAGIAHRLCDFQIVGFYCDFQIVGFYCEGEIFKVHEIIRTMQLKISSPTSTVHYLQ